MPVPGRPDRIYPLTLAELAFIIIFLILVLTGGMMVKGKGGDREALPAGPPPALSAPGDDPDRILSALVRKAEGQRLRQRIEDLEARLSALEEVKQRLPENPEPAAAELASALVFKRALERAAGEPIPPGREAELAAAYAEARRARPGGPDGVAQLARENRDLRAQLAWRESQAASRGGRDFPPCWVDGVTGKPQYLFAIEIRPRGLGIAPAWPAERDQDAAQLPGVAELAGAGVLPLAQFRARVAPLDAHSRRHHCRHYVRLINRVTDLATFNRQRYAVEEFFYKYEPR
ncbi:hypothetical protein [Candidatus Methylocalor cossyra]|uniref:Uncharacterized protein n=1 Tax=Candidatus Methylocalor cossyra TaxID=3108543 RepID=A0ABM9NJP3_9GAMM